MCILHVLTRSDGSAMSFKPLPSRYGPTRVWSDCSVVLCWLVACTMISVWFQNWNECNLHHLVAANIARHQGICASFCFEGFVRNPPVCRFVSILPLVGVKHGRFSSGFSREILLVRSDWLKVVRWLASQNPLVTRLNIASNNCCWYKEAS